jgi:hypothetical protein
MHSQAKSRTRMTLQSVMQAHVFSINLLKLSSLHNLGVCLWGGTSVLALRSDELILLSLFDDVSRPATHSRDDEDRSEEVHRDPALMVG